MSRGQVLYETYRDVFIGNANWWALTAEQRLQWEQVAERAGIRGTHG
jgi:hypothetical protein